MVNTPVITDQNWDELVETCRKRVIDKLTKRLGKNIPPRILFEKVLDPRYIRDYTSAHKGSLYGLSHNRKISAFLRHPNYCPQIKDLYFCGGTVHPGGGIPLCLLSAKIVDQLIHE